MDRLVGHHLASMVVRGLKDGWVAGDEDEAEVWTRMVARDSILLQNDFSESGR